MSAHLRLVKPAEPLGPLPFSIPDEQQMLGFVMVNPDVLTRLGGILEPTHFYEPVHQRMFDAMLSLAARGEAPDTAAIGRMFEADPDLADVGPYSRGKYAPYLASSVLDIRNYDRTARVLIDLWQRRSALELLHTYRDRLGEISWTETGIAVLSQMTAGLEAIASHTRASAAARLNEVAIYAAQEATDRSNGKGEPPMSTGLRDLDQRLGGGYQRGQLLVLGGRPGQGKTSFALWSAIENAKAGRHVGFFSLEMPSVELAQRALAAEARRPFKAIRAGDRETVSQLPDALRPLQGLRFDLDDTPALTLPDLTGRAWELHRAEKLDLLVVDHIGLMRPTEALRRANKVHQVEEVTNGLKALAKRLDCPILALCQLSRANEARDDKRPTMADLRDSGTIEQDADVALFVHREEYYLRRSKPARHASEERRAQWTADLMDSQNKADLIIAKNRQGEAGDSVEVFADVSQNRWGDLER